MKHIEWQMAHINKSLRIITSSLPYNRNLESELLNNENLKENERKVLEAIKVLFESVDDIEIFNKKAIYLYLREITGLNTKQVVNNLNKIRARYKGFKRKWDEDDL